MVLQDNGCDDLPITANGGFHLQDRRDRRLRCDGEDAAHGPAQTCSVANGTGTATANVTNVLINCGTTGLTIGGSVSGLIGSGLVLQNNGGNNFCCLRPRKRPFYVFSAGYRRHRLCRYHSDPAFEPGPSLLGRERQWHRDFERQQRGGHLHAAGLQNQRISGRPGGGGGGHPRIARQCGRRPLCYRRYYIHLSHAGYEWRHLQRKRVSTAKQPAAALQHFFYTGIAITNVSDVLVDCQHNDWAWTRGTLQHELRRTITPRLQRRSFPRTSSFPPNSALPAAETLPHPGPTNRAKMALRRKWLSVSEPVREATSVLSERSLGF